MLSTSEQPHGSVPLNSLYRIDTLTVPVANRTKFFELVNETHAVLRRQPGFQRDLIVERADSSASCDFVTLVEWDSREAMEAAGEAVQRRHQQLGNDVQRYIADNGIAIDRGVYRPVVA
jgi:heme-degrading monooxygenase HmoA